MKNRIVAILEPKTIGQSDTFLKYTSKGRYLFEYTSSELNVMYHEKIDEVLTDPNVHIVISENFIFAAKYLERRKFRNCTVYHIGEDTPKHNIGKFKTKGGFTSLIELEESLKQDSTETISF